MIVVIQYDILKIFIPHFSKINHTYFIIYYSFINERNLRKIFQNTMLSQNEVESYFQSKL